MNFSNDDIGKRVSFDIYGNSIIGGDYTNVEILAVLGAKAIAEYNPKSKHESIYSTLPEPRPQSHTEYKYYLIQLANGRLSIVGDPWIKAGSVIRGTANKLLIEIQNTTPSDIGKIKALLRGEGYTVSKASITNS